jgi:putative hydrolase of the HAD superfamily
LTNGWDRHLREKAAKKFNIDFEEMNNRHALTFDTYEIGKISLDEYLNRIVFYQPRPFSLNEFKEFMFTQSHSYPEMVQLIMNLKQQYSLRVVVVSNEGRELSVDRIQRFRMKEYVDVFVCSGFVGLRKPDVDIYRLAWDLAQVEPKEVIYIDDRPLLAEIGRQLGMQVIQHITFEQTQAVLKDFLSVKPTGRTNGYVRASSDIIRQ